MPLGLPREVVFTHGPVLCNVCGTYRNPNCRCMTETTETTPATVYPIPAPDQVVPRELLVDAYRLARAYGHRWATEIEIEDPDLRQEWTAASIDAMCRAADRAAGYTWAGGIFAPTVMQTAEGEIYISHVTGTGRLEWQCWAESTDIFVYTPDENVAAYPDGRNVIMAHAGHDGDMGIVTFGAVTYAQRHLHALADAVEALIGLDGLEECAEYWSSALPDPCHWQVAKVEEDHAGGLYKRAAALRDIAENVALTSAQAAHLKNVTREIKYRTLDALHQAECTLEAIQRTC